MIDRINPEMRTAIVISDADKLKLGRVQVRIIPELQDVEDSLLPWAKPFVGNDENNIDIHIPEEGESIKVLVLDKEFQQIRYLQKGNFLANTDSDLESSWNTWKNKVTDITSFTYPQPKILKVINNQLAYFCNTDTGESGFVYTNNDYFLRDKDGQLIMSLNAGQKVEMNSSGELIINDKIGNKVSLLSGGSIKVASNNGGEIVLDSTITIKNTALNLKNILDDLFSVVTDIITPANLVATTMGGPVTYIPVATDLPKVISAKASLDALLNG